MDGKFGGRCEMGERLEKKEEKARIDFPGWGTHEEKLGKRRPFGHCERVLHQAA
jgi:hypothetical protein